MVCRRHRRWEVQIAEPAEGRVGFVTVCPILFTRPLTTKSGAVREAHRALSRDVNAGMGIRAVNVETGEEVCLRSLGEAWRQTRVADCRMVEKEKIVHSPDAAQYLKVRRPEDGTVEIEAINRAVTGVPVWLDAKGVDELLDVLGEARRSL